MSNILKRSRFIIITAILFLICTATVGAYQVLVKNIKVVDDGNSHSYSTSANTVKEFFDEQNIQIGKDDYVNTSLNSTLQDGQTIMIERAISVNITVDGVKMTVNTCKETVDELLSEKKIEVENTDKINPVKSAKLKAGMNIEIQTYREEKVTETEKIPFVTEKRDNNNLPEGEEKIFQTGSEGEKIKTYTVTYVAGKETDKKFVSETVSKQPTNTIIEVGTKKAEPVQQISEKTKAVAETGSNVVDTGNGTKEYTKVLNVRATAYTPYEGGGNGITYSGMKARHGVVAVDPNVIPLHSKLYIEGYGEAIAGDTGGAIKGNRIDVCFESYDTVVNYGVRNVKVYILK